jgi:peptide/nickel transport system substrate-binding protein
MGAVRASRGPTWRRLLALATLTVVGLLVGCDSGETAAPTTDEQQAERKPFVINYATPPATIDPAEASGVTDGGFISNFYVTLTQYGTKEGPNGFPEDDLANVEPYLAESWEVQDDGKTYVFTLRDDAVFPDGTPMDSAAVKYSLERALTRGGIGAYFMNANKGDGFVKSIEAPDPRTVIIRLRSKSDNAAYEALHTYANLSIVNPKVVEAHGGVDPKEPNEWMASHSAGGGPYLLEEYDPSRRAVLVANPSFFGPKPREPRVIINFMRGQETLLLQAGAKRADVTVGLSYQSTASLRGDPCCQIAANPLQSEVVLELPNRHPPFDNKTFRQALSYAVPYEGIIDKVAFGFAESFFGPYPPAFSNFNPQLGKARELDLEKAKQLIAQSGVKLPVKVDVIVREGENDSAQIATIVKDTWRGLGVNVNVKVLQADPFATARYTTEPKDYALIAPRTLIFGNPSWHLAGGLACGNFVNTSNYCNPKVDALLRRAIAAEAADPSTAQPLWDELARLVVEDAHHIPIYSPQYVVVLRKGVKYHFGALPMAIWKWGR